MNQIDVFKNNKSILSVNLKEGNITEAKSANHVLVPIIPVVQLPPIIPVFRVPTTQSPVQKDQLTFVLKPSAKAIAGKRGTAIASPYSRAVLPEEGDVNIIYEPEAVAIAGPGGIAHAQSELDIFRFQRY